VPAGLVSVIGPPAAGKTTLSGWLAEELPARLILEDYAGNPFLAASYLGRSEMALAAQLYFLFSRVGQLRAADWPDAGAAVSDYGFCHDRIYAERVLTGSDLAVYNRLSAQAAEQVRPPDLLVYLTAPVGLLLDRIARRGRPHERGFTREFIESLRPAYEAAAAAAECPVVTVDVSAVDLLGGPARGELLAGVREVLA